MSWGIFKIYDWIKSLKTPVWLVEFLDEIVKSIIYPVLTTIGKEAKDLICQLIVEASRKDMSGEAKFNWVYNEFKSRWGGGDIKDHILNLSIELLVSYLKAKGII